MDVLIRDKRTRAKAVQARRSCMACSPHARARGEQAICARQAFHARHVSRLHTRCAPPRQAHPGRARTPEMLTGMYSMMCRTCCSAMTNTWGSATSHMMLSAFPIRSQGTGSTCGPARRTYRKQWRGGGTRNISHDVELKSLPRQPPE